MTFTVTRHGDVILLDGIETDECCNGADPCFSSVHDRLVTVRILTPGDMAFDLEHGEFERWGGENWQERMV